jgi:hypothetical protein
LSASDRATSSFFLTAMSVDSVKKIFNNKVKELLLLLLLLLH